MYYVLSSWSLMEKGYCLPYFSLVTECPKGITRFPDASQTSVPQNRLRAVFGFLKATVEESGDLEYTKKSRGLPEGSGLLLERLHVVEGNEVCGPASQARKQKPSARRSQRKAKPAVLILLLRHHL